MALASCQLKSNWPRSFLTVSLQLSLGLPLFLLPLGFNGGTITEKESFLKRGELAIIDLRYYYTVAYGVVYIICLFNSALAIFVFHQQLFRGTIVARLLLYFFMGSIIHMTAMGVFVLLFYRPDLGFGGNEEWLCKTFWFLKQAISDFLVLILCLIPALQILLVLFPLQVGGFRGKTTYGQRILLGFIFFAFVTNLATMFSPVLNTCRFRGTPTCVLNTQHYYHFYYYLLPIVIFTIYCAILYSKSPKRKMSTPIERSFSSTISSPLNRIVLTQSLLYFFTNFPMNVYYIVYRSESDLQCDESFQWRFFAYKLCATLQFLNLGINSTMFMITCPLYRTAAINLILTAIFNRCGEPTGSPTNSQTGRHSRTISEGNYEVSVLNSSISGADVYRKSTRCPERLGDIGDDIATGLRRLSVSPRRRTITVASLYAQARPMGGMLSQSTVSNTPEITATPGESSLSMTQTKTKSIVSSAR